MGQHGPGVRRRLRRRGSRGPCGDAPRGWRDRHGCACAGEIRASSHDAGCWAGTYACSLGFRSRIGMDKLGGRTVVCSRRNVGGSARPRDTGTNRQPDAARPRHDTWCPRAGSNLAPAAADNRLIHRPRGVNVRLLTPPVRLASFPVPAGPGYAQSVDNHVDVKVPTYGRSAGGRAQVTTTQREWMGSGIHERDRPDVEQPGQP